MNHNLFSKTIYVLMFCMVLSIYPEAQTPFNYDSLRARIDSIVLKYHIPGAQVNDAVMEIIIKEVPSAAPPAPNYRKKTKLCGPDIIEALIPVLRCFTFWSGCRISYKFMKRMGNYIIKYYWPGKKHLYIVSGKVNSQA